MAYSAFHDATWRGVLKLNARVNARVCVCVLACPHYLDASSHTAAEYRASRFASAPKRIVLRDTANRCAPDKRPSSRRRRTYDLAATFAPLYGFNAQRNIRLLPRSAHAEVCPCDTYIRTRVPRRWMSQPLSSVARYFSSILWQHMCICQQYERPSQYARHHFLARNRTLYFIRHTGRSAT